MSKKSKTLVRWFTVAGFLLVTICTLMQMMQSVARTAFLDNMMSTRTLTNSMQEESSRLPVSSGMMHHQAYNFSALSNNKTNIRVVIQRNSPAVVTNATAAPGDNATSPDSTKTTSISLVDSNSSNLSFEDLRIAIFVTTHMTDDHISFLRRCWPAALEIVPMLRQSDCVLFTTADPPSDLHPSVFDKFHSFQMHKYDNPGYHEGALLAMTVAMDKNWFADYDWVIRVNADVLIREDSFFRQVFVDPSVDAIFVKCVRSIQTDFFAFRPNSTVPGAFRRQQRDRPNAEPDTTLAFQETLHQTKRYKLLEGGHSNRGHCRVVGRDSPVIHDHDFLNQCPDLKTHHAQNIW